MFNSFYVHNMNMMNLMNRDEPEPCIFFVLK